MKTKEINAVARAAIRYARAHKDRDPRSHGIAAMVQQELAAKGFAWTGSLDGCDQSIRSISECLRRDAAAGRILDMRHC